MTNPIENTEKQAITADIGGLKCDAPTCDYRDDSITVDQYESLIDAPCPKCGASLLTPADYARVKQMVDVTTFINSLSTEELAKLTGLSIEDLNNPEQATLSLALDGTGNIQVVITNEDGNNT